jgi:predicted nucleotidyltransferase
LCPAFRQHPGSACDRCGSGARQGPPSQQSRSPRVTGDTDICHYSLVWMAMLAALAAIRTWQSCGRNAWGRGEPLCFRQSNTGGKIPYTGTSTRRGAAETGRRMATIEDLLQRLVAWAQTQPDVCALYLYGSYAEGRANALSDVDVAVLAREGTSREQLWALERRSTARWPESVELRVLHLAPLPFRYERYASRNALGFSSSSSTTTIHSL